MNLVDNTFASNGQIRGEGTGLNGVEFFTDFTGTAIVTGNDFENNTAAGIFSGSAGPITFRLRTIRLTTMWLEFSLARALRRSVRQFKGIRLWCPSARRTRTWAFWRSAA